MSRYRRLDLLPLHQPSLVFTDWERLRNGINPKPADAHRIYAEILTSFWQPQPSHTLFETKTFKGGLAIHTTEFNLSSETDTVREGWCVLFTRPQIEALCDRIVVRHGPTVPAEEPHHRMLG